MVFGNGVKNIQAAAYNGARTVYEQFLFKLLLLLGLNAYISQESNYNFATICFMSRGLDNHQVGLN